MDKFLKSMKNEEKVIMKLRKLYEQYGYQKIKLNKFEDYDLYNENLDFIKTKNIITFMDPNGRLQVLRPDITLSIVKKYIKDIKIENEKLYYLENVYRLSHEDKEYKEMNQIGVEVLGIIDEYSNIEIIKLALESLKIISKNYILDISNINFLSGLLEEINLEYTLNKKILLYISKKNNHDLEKLLDEEKIDGFFKEKLLQICNLSGNFSYVLEKAEKIVINEKMKKALDELKSISLIFHKELEENKIVLDLSIINSLDYYNGIIFQGYIQNNPKAVLSGGNYEKLIKKVEKNKGAIGFAVYLDEVNIEDRSKKNYDFDILILYKNGDYNKLLKIVDGYIKEGFSIRTERYINETMENFTYKEKYFFENNELLGEE